MEDKIDRLCRLTIYAAVTYFGLHILLYLYRIFIEGG
jgi:hypothetical protein